MKIIAHRVNKIKDLKQIPQNVGVEIDVRGFKDDLILNHEPLIGGDGLEKYLKVCGPRFVVFNVKEAGIEDKIHALAKRNSIKNYFLLDVEFPYIYRATRQKEKRIAMRYSEDEGIDTVLKYKGMADWVWIDTNTRLPLNKKVIRQLEGFKTCLVSPDRWGRPEDITKYRKKMKALDFHLNAVMVGMEYVDLWTKKI